MIRAHLIFTLATLAIMGGCSQGDEDASPKAGDIESVRAESWRKSQALEGKETYEAACASCHDQGEGKAPAIGNQEAWTGRSDLWTAILSEHANAGYLKMPEKGGHSELSEETVSAAVEYMLMQTFPELLRD